MTVLLPPQDSLDEAAVSNPERRRLLSRAAALGAASACGLARGQPRRAYPGKAVRFVVPFAAGGPVDTTTRLFAAALGARWGQPALVDNRAGAGGLVGAEWAARLPPDGHHLFVGSIHHAVNPFLHERLNYDIEKDFAPISLVASFPVFIVVHPSVPARTLPQLLALARQGSQPLSYGSSGSGGGTHLAGALFNMQAGTQLVHVPYRGSAPAMNDLLGGQVQVMFSDAPSALAHIQSGRIKVLAVASAQRSDMLPQVPTAAESGLPGYEAYSWAALFAPAQTPQALVQQINADFVAVMQQPALQAQLLRAGAQGEAGSPEQMREHLRRELKKWGEVVKTAAIAAG